MQTPRGRLSDLRLIPRIEANERVVAFAQTTVGRACLLALFAATLLVLTEVDRRTVCVTVLLLGLTTFMPERRRTIVALGPVLFLLARIPRVPSSPLVGLGAIACGIGLVWCVRRWPDLLPCRRPVASLLILFSFVIVIADTVPRSSTVSPLLWDIVATFAAYVWFVAYAFTDRAAKSGSEVGLEVGTLRPFWGSTTTPFPKGAAYLRRIEAKDARELAVVQLKGLKLATWAVLLWLASRAWMWLFHGYLQIPTAAHALELSVHGTPAAWHVRWESQLLTLFESVLDISILGHQFIGCCRMAGFNALRNTYRPLASKTVSEFFNRYYYYFKELVVDLFFYPAFLRYWKGHKRLRTAFATFAAACFGNAFYHFTREWTVIREQGLASAARGFSAYVVYTVLLATALSISQVRKRAPQNFGFLRGQLLPSCGVVVVFSLLEVFDSTSSSCALVERFRFMAGLFVIHL